MPKNRLFFTLGLALLIPTTLPAQAPPTGPTVATPVAPPPSPATEAEVALDEAIKKVRGLESVSAEVVQSADMLGQRFTIKGRYLKAAGHRVRLELRITDLGDSAGQMVQVCDGETFWDYQRVLDGSRCQTMKIGELLKKLEAPEFTADFREQVLAGMGFAGPEALLAGLRKAIKFDRKEPGTLAVQIGKDRTETREVWVLRGEWQDRDALTGPRNTPLPAGMPPPPYVPSLATVWLGRQDGWPYKVQLEGRARSLLLQGRQPNAEGRPVPIPRADKLPPQERPSRLILIYGNLVLNPKLGAADFAFQPPDPASVVDQTKEALDGLEQRKTAIQNENRQKAEAEKAESTPAVPVPKLQPEAEKTP